MPTPATQAGSNQAAGDHFASVTHALGRLIARLGSAHRETWVGSSRDGRRTR
jgi:hypothetical protein